MWCKSLWGPLDFIKLYTSAGHLGNAFTYAFQIEQDFRLLFGEGTANKFLEKWPTCLKSKVIKESHGLVPTTELVDLLRNAELAAEAENGMLVL